FHSCALIQDVYEDVSCCIIKWLFLKKHVHHPG
ncbi:hypothetical protein X975_16830, partial [Stegodyphus mimosarum]